MTTICEHLFSDCDICTGVGVWELWANHNIVICSHEVRRHNCLWDIDRARVGFLWREERFIFAVALTLCVSWSSVQRHFAVTPLDPERTSKLPQLALGSPQICSDLLVALRAPCTQHRADYPEFREAFFFSFLSFPSRLRIGISAPWKRTAGIRLSQISTTCVFHSPFFCGIFPWMDTNSVEIASWDQCIYSKEICSKCSKNTSAPMGLCILQKTFIVTFVKAFAIKGFDPIVCLSRIIIGCSIEMLLTRSKFRAHDGNAF